MNWNYPGSGVARLSVAVVPLGALVRLSEGDLGSEPVSVTCEVAPLLEHLSFQAVFGSKFPCMDTQLWL